MFFFLKLNFKVLKYLVSKLLYFRSIYWYFIQYVTFKSKPLLFQDKGDVDRNRRPNNDTSTLTYNADSRESKQGQ